MIRKLHVGDEVLMSGTVRRYTIRRLKDHERVRDRILTPIPMPEADPEDYYHCIGVVALVETYPIAKQGVILGWTHFVTGRYTVDELGRRSLTEHGRQNVIAVQPWNEMGKYRKPVFCLLSQLQW
jgi:hypothetical protein